MPNLLGNYKVPEGIWDEMMASDGSIRPAWQGLAATLENLGLEDLQRRQQLLGEQLRLNGVTYNVYGDSQGANRLWPLDPVPMILESAEWERIERGLIQRSELLDAILRDVYGPRKLLREGLLPALFLYSHPGFQRACAGNASVQNRMLRFYSADIVRSAKGNFQVISDRGQNPSGYGYALENRSVLSRTLPSLLRQSEVHRLEHFFQQFRRSLAEAAPAGVRDPYIVLLSPGPENETYFEQAYLANFLGLPLVRGGDLTAREGGIQLLTLDGPKQVDVILRRVDDSFCDPLELNGSSLLGVPGLLQAVRNCKVTVCNALGSGILAGSGLMAFLPAICRKILGEEMLLPSVPTYWCGDPEQCKIALDNFDQMVFKPLYQGPKRSTWFADKMTREQKEKLILRIRAKPQMYLAQEMLSLSTAPCLTPTGLEPRSLVLRSFLAASNHAYSVMPGGLSRVSAHANSFEVTGQQGGISKDTWILSSEPVSWATPPELVPLPLRLNRQQRPLPGYATENLFWFGRYQERLTCQFRVWREIARPREHFEFSEPLDNPQWLKLLETYQPNFFSLTDDITVIEKSLQASLENEESLGSPAYNASALRRSARSIRDLLPDDCWLAVHALKISQALPSLDKNEEGALMETLDTVLLQLSGLVGIELESIGIGPVRRFIQLGRHIERAICTLRSLNAFAGGNLYPSDESLESLLSIHASDLIYRQRYQRELQVFPVIDILLADEFNPRSVAYQLSQFNQELMHLPLSESTSYPLCQKEIAKAINQIREFAIPEKEGMDSEEGNYSLIQLLADLEIKIGKVTDLLAKESFQSTAKPQSLREWT